MKTLISGKKVYYQHPLAVICILFLSDTDKVIW